MHQRHLRVSGNGWFEEGVVFMLLLGVYLITHGTTFGWDDHHLEIPLLKSLIDPDLYPRDYYVASLKSHFPSLFYPALARLIPHPDWIPLVYRLLFMLSRAVMFYFWYRTWRFVFGSRWMGFAAVWGLIVLLRIPEFLYRTFSHQEAALALLAVAVYALYRKRHMTAALIAGLAANIHALYAGFVMTYILSDLFMNRSLESLKKRFLSLLVATVIFVCAAGGVLVMLFSRLSLKWLSTPHDDWLELYRLACPQNFLFRGEGLSFFHNHSIPEIFTMLSPFLVTFWLWGLLASKSVFFRRDRTSRILVTAAACQWGASVLFTDIIPIRFVVDLNMIRHIQFMQWVLFAHLIRFLPSLWMRLNPLETGASVAGLFMLRTTGLPNFVGLTLLTASATGTDDKKQKGAWRKAKTTWVGWGATLIAVVWLMALCLKNPVQRNAFIVWPACAALISGLVWCLNRCNKTPHDLRRLAWVIMAGLLLVRTGQLGLYHIKRLKIEQTGSGFWALQRAWIDIQKATKQKTPQNALILVPYDMEMGGFRIFSERSIVFSYRDIGIVGFDWSAAREWRRRYRILKPYRVIPRGDVRRAVVDALRLYQPDYIVTSPFVTLNHPHLFEKIYTNGVFTLHRIRYDNFKSHTNSLNK